MICYFFIDLNTVDYFYKFSFFLVINFVSNTLNLSQIFNSNICHPLSYLMTTKRFHKKRTDSEVSSE
jgi:hypothetical protein